MRKLRDREVNKIPEVTERPGADPRADAFPSPLNFIYLHRHIYSNAAFSRSAPCTLRVSAAWELVAKDTVSGVLAQRLVSCVEEPDR